MSDRRFMAACILALVRHRTLPAAAKANTLLYAGFLAKETLNNSA
jgi:hypothetical protein